MSNFDTLAKGSTAKQKYTLNIEVSSGPDENFKKNMPTTINIIDPIIHTEPFSMSMIEYVEGDGDSIRYNLDNYFSMKGNNFGMELRFDQ